MVVEPPPQPHCSVAYCDALETGCDLGFKPHADCPRWQARTIVGDNEPALSTDVRLPWAGASLGTDDLTCVSTRTAPRLIGIVGPQNAGKTTLLIAWYLLISRGRRLPKRLFAGSCSLGGWENLAHWLRWPPGAGPMFPPHTVLHDGPRPGLLHLAFRRDDGKLEDVLFTDAPGEWFTKWAVNRSEPGAEGARWTIRNADAFVVVVDREALAGKDMGVARSRLFDLVRRLADERAERPIAIVWTKLDVAINPAIQIAIEEVLHARLPDCSSFPVTVHGASRPENAQALLQPLCSLLTLPSAKRATLPTLAVVDAQDAFLRFRGK
jgi:hypothetical protein